MAREQPNPRVIVTAGVNLLRRMGLGDRLALETIETATHTAALYLRDAGVADLEWLRNIWKEASRRKNALGGQATPTGGNTRGTQHRA
jgi:hypothetical protein